MSYLHLIIRTEEKQVGYMGNNSNLGLTQADLKQLEMATLALEKQLASEKSDVQPKNPHIFSNLDVNFFDFADTEISYFGI
jgi:uncharacterized protein (DUF952 family)